MMIIIAHNLPVPSLVPKLLVNLAMLLSLLVGSVFTDSAQ